MQPFLASDVVYQRARRRRSSSEALDDNEIGGQRIAASQFLPSLEWLDAEQRRRPRSAPQVAAAATAASRGEPAPGLHGHGLDSTAVGDTTLQPDEPNRIPAADDIDVHRDVHQPGRERRVRRQVTSAHRGRRRADHASRDASTRSTPGADGRGDDPARRRRRRSARGDHQVAVGRSRRGEDRQQHAPSTTRSSRGLAAGLAGRILRRRGRADRHRAASSRSRPRGARADRARAGRSCSPSGCGACARRSASCSASTAHATSSRHAAELQQAFAALRDRVEDVAGAARRAPRRGRGRGSTARSPTARSCATTPTARCPATSRRRSRCSTRAQRRRRLLDPPPRPGARVRQAGARGRGRARALAGGGRGRPAARSPASALGTLRAMRVGFLGPAGTFSEEALLAGRRRRRLRALPLPTVHDAVLAVQEGAAERGARADRELARGLGQRDARRARGRDARDVVIVGEVVHPIRHCLDRARAARRSTQSRAVVSHPQALAQCARFLRDARCRRARWSPAPRRPRRCALVAERAGDGAVGARSAAARAAELYGCAVLRAGVEDVAGNETRFVWLARAGRRTARDAAAAVEDLARVLGRRRRRARAGSCAACRSSRSAAST